MRKIIDYGVVISTLDMEVFQKYMDEALNKGWQPYGNLQCSFNENGALKQLIQPLVKYEKRNTVAKPHEQVLQEGVLSKTTTYKIIVSGNIGEKEIQRMIDKLELDKDVFKEHQFQTEALPTRENEFVTKGNKNA